MKWAGRSSGLLGTLVALLVVTASVAGVGGGQGAVSTVDEHTTDSELSSGTLVNLTDSGGAQRLGTDYLDLNGSVQTASYTSSNLTGENIEQGGVWFELKNGNVTVTWQGWTGSSWTDLSSNNYSQGGTIQEYAPVTSIGKGYSKYRVKVDFTRTASNDYEFFFYNDTLRAQTYNPELDENSAKPQGGTKIQSPTVNFSIDLNDTDFGTQNGDSVTVTFYDAGPDGQKGGGDDSTIGSETLASNGTANASQQATGGTQYWYANATDSYGNTISTQVFTYETPSVLSIYKESSPTELVNNTSVTATFYFNGSGVDTQTVTRTVSDGTVSFAGLPAGEPFVVTVEANGYLNRRVWIESLVKNQQIYLLNSSAEHRDVIFEIEDYTGNFPQSDTVLQIQRIINGTWQPVFGDYFGATGEFPAQLAYNVRHRLVLVNVDTGERRIMGTYTPLADGSERVLVDPTTRPDPPPRNATVEWSPSVSSLPAEDNTTVETILASGTRDLANWTVTYYHVNGTRNVTLFQTSGVDPDGVTVNQSLDLTDLNGSVKVVVSWTDSTGYSDRAVRVYDLRQVYDTPTLVKAIDGLVAGIPAPNVDPATTFLGLMGFIIGLGAIGSAANLPTELLGLVGILLIAGFAVIGFLSYNLLFAVLVGGMSVAYLRRQY